jgi:protein phosphatase
LLVRQVYFVGTDDQGRVALFRGVPYELPLGLDLYSEQYAIGVQASSLSPARKAVIVDHRLRSKDDATDLINDIDANEGVAPPPPAPKKKQAKKQAAAKNAQNKGGK